MKSVLENHIFQKIVTKVLNFKPKADNFKKKYKK